VVILVGQFPWSPTILNSRFNLKNFIWNQSSFLSIASAYYSRFGISLDIVESLVDFESSCESAYAVVDEGWPFSLKDLKRMSKLARRIPFFRVGGGYNISTQDLKGGPEVWKVLHIMVGGVTDADSKLVRWYSLKPGLSSIPEVDNTSVDLRNILKVGIDGVPAAKPWCLPEEAVGKVVFLRMNEVSAAGLFPLQNTKNWPLVQTRFGIWNWVTRELTGSEILMLKDIPEPLHLLLGYRMDAEAMTRSLFDSCHVPLKSLSVMLLPALEVLATTATTSPEEALKYWKKEKFPDRMEEQGGLSGEQEIKTEDDGGIKTTEDLEVEERSCQSSAELVDLLRNRLITINTESRSKKSDYEIPSETIWDVRTLPYCRIRDKERALNWRRSFEVLRNVMLRNWKRGIIRSIIHFRMENGSPGFDIKTKAAIKDCLERVSATSIWGWEGGSRPFFWNWP